MLDFYVSELNNLGSNVIIPDTYIQINNKLYLNIRIVKYIRYLGPDTDDGKVLTYTHHNSVCKTHKLFAFLN